MGYSTIVVFAVAALLVAAAVGESPAPAPSKKSPAAPRPVGPAAKSPESSLSPSSAVLFGSPISAPPSDAPAPAPSGAVLHRLSVAGSVAVVIFGAVLVI